MAAAASVSATAANAGGRASSWARSSSTGESVRALWIAVAFAPAAQSGPANAHVVQDEAASPGDVLSEQGTPRVARSGGAIALDVLSVEEIALEVPGVVENALDVRSVLGSASDVPRAVWDVSAVQRVMETTFVA